jgi:hypothetical protein
VESRTSARTSQRYFIGRVWTFTRHGVWDLTWKEKEEGRNEE